MRVLWILNMVLPNVASALELRTSFSGGWLVDYANKLAADEDITLATMTYANVEQPIDREVCGIRNFIFPGAGKRLLFTSKKTLEDCQKVLDAFQPDVIHIHGTEYSVGYSMLQLKPNIPTLLTIQGILTNISKEYYGGLSLKEILCMPSPKEWLRGKTPLFSKLLFLKNAKREREVLQQVRYVTGRTLWDKAVMLSINDQLEYFRLNYNLREEFYDAPLWDREQMQPHTIYTGAASYPLKGLHILLRAVAIVKKSYPDVKLLVPGNKITGGAKCNSYERYLLKLMKELDLEDTVEYVGRQDARGVTEMLRRANVCVVPSAMEGASATICEGMMVGTPCICAYRGGMTALLRDGDSGFTYDFPEYPVLAEKIKMLFADGALCEEFSRKERADALVRHDRDTNYSMLKGIYQQLAIAQ